MRKNVTFSPTLGSPESDKSFGKEWRKQNGIQENSTVRTIDLEEINSEESKSQSEEAAKQAVLDAGLRLRKSGKSVTNLAALAEESKETTHR